MEQENLEGRVDRIEAKLDGLAASVDERFNQVDKRFDQMDERFNALEVSIDVRFNDVTAAFVEQRQYTDSAFTTLLGQMSAGFQRIERKLDGFIEVQTRTNELVEKRLTRLEGPRRRSRR